MKILVIALARAGGHGFINWLCKQLEGHVVFKNNVFQDLTPRSVDHYGDKNAEVSTTVYSFENFDLQGYKELYENKDPFDKIIILNRDPFNWIASSIAKGTKLGLLDQTFIPGPNQIEGGLHYVKWFCQSMARIDMFRQYMQQCLGEIDLLGRDFTHVSYNEWFTSKEYREGICKALDIPFTDKGLQDVPDYGGGSSFNQRDMNSEAQKMNVLERWKTMANDPRYLSFITEDIREYSRKYFNFEPF